jgi:hypothetical protein
MMEADAIHDLHMSHHHTSMCHIIIPIYTLWNMWNIHITWSKMMEADAIHDDKISPSTAIYICYNTAQYYSINSSKDSSKDSVQ